MHEKAHRIQPYRLKCNVSIHLYSASRSAHQSEALPVIETQKAVLRKRK